jgi:hypothetical protein
MTASDQDLLSHKSRDLARNALKSGVGVTAMKTRYFSLLAFVFSATTLSAVPVQAQGLLDFGKILLGLPTDTKDPIDYRERAPLVVPPNQNLRPPSETADVAQRRANWPQDPDVLARRKAAEDARKPVMVDAVTGRDGTIGRRMTIQEIRAGRVAGAEVPKVPQPVILNDRDLHNVHGGVTTINEMDRLSAQQQAANTAGNKDARAEPQREFLTDPPSGLRKPSEKAAFRSTREGSLGPTALPSPMDIFKEGPSTR